MKPQSKEATIAIPIKVSLRVFCVKTEHLKWVRLSTVASEFSNVFIEYQADSTIIIVMSSSKGVFIWEIARCFFWYLTFSPSKTEDLHVNTCAGKSRPFSVLIHLNALVKWFEEVLS